MGYRQWRNSIDGILRSLDRWRMLSEDLEPKGGILTGRRQIWRYLGIMVEKCRWWGRNCVTERQRCWKTWRKQ
jgi:hypothetical protein